MWAWRRHQLAAAGFLLCACGGAATNTAPSPTAGAVLTPSTGAATPTPEGTALPLTSLHLSISAPPTVTANSPFIVRVDVDTPLQIVAPNGNLIPGTGHFHLFIDRPPLPPGAFTPQDPDIIHTIVKNNRVPGFTPGTHTIAAALADGQDRITAVPPVSATVVAQ